MNITSFPYNLFKWTIIFHSWKILCIKALIIPIITDKIVIATEQIDIFVFFHSINHNLYFILCPHIILIWKEDIFSFCNTCVAYKIFCPALIHFVNDKSPFGQIIILYISFYDFNTLIFRTIISNNNFVCFYSLIFYTIQLLFYEAFAVV